MTTDAALTRATRVVTLSTGQELELRALTDRQWVEIDEHVRNHVLKTAMSALQHVPREERQEYIRQAVIASAQCSLSTMPRLLTSREVLSLVISKMSVQPLKQISMGSVEDLTLLSLTFMHLNGLTAEESEPKNALTTQTEE